MIEKKNEQKNQSNKQIMIGFKDIHKHNSNLINHQVLQISLIKSP